MKITVWHLYVVGNEGLPQKKSNFILHLTFFAVLAVCFGVFPTFPTALCVFHFLQYFVYFNRLTFRSGRLKSAGRFLNRCGGVPSSRLSQLAPSLSGSLCACLAVFGCQLLYSVRQALGLRAMPAPLLPHARGAPA